jgi:hypothetical protein
MDEEEMVIFLPKAYRFVPKGKGYVLVPVPEFGDLLGIARGANPVGYRDRNDCY